MVTIKSQRELDLMREAGKHVAGVLGELAKMAKAGVTLLELDAAAERLTLERDCKPAFKGYHGFRHTLCTSVNEQIVHGVPTNRALVDGDIVGLDFGLVYKGFYGDSAVTVPIGKVSDRCVNIMRATRDSLYAAIDASRDGNSLRDVARAVEAVIKPYGYSIVREFVGHGIGQKLHEDPQVPNYVAGASSLKLRKGMTICIEPMINEGTAEVRVLDDQWTAVTADGKLSAHFEHTLAITDGPAEVLTEWNPARFDAVLGPLTKG
ncbi:type I methionyl aminopeptidase [bacterium]|nr:type I methionyl aminopeptidase [bacterium]